MTMLITDGFDHYTTKADTAANITAYLQAAGYVVNNATAATFAIIDGQDVNSLALRLNIVAGSATPPSVSRSITTPGTLVVFGFSFKGSQARLRFARIAGVIDLDWDAATGKMKVGTTLGTDVIILSAYWYIEIEIDKTTNEVRVWANDTLQLTVPLAGGVGNTYTITWGMSASSASAAVMEIDDFYALDNNGGVNIARTGPLQMVTRAPTSDVTTQWTPVGSSGTHASILAQLAPGITNAPYLQANIDGKTDKFTSNNVLPNANTIFSVALVAYARKGDLDNRNLGLLIDTGSNSAEIPVTLTTAFQYQQAMFEKAPGGAAWNQNTVESSQLGIVAR